MLCVSGLYCSGWVKTGPVGVILDTMSNAFETANNIIQDYKEGILSLPPPKHGLLLNCAVNNNSIFLLIGKLEDPTEDSSSDILSFLSSLPG